MSSTPNRPAAPPIPGAADARKSHGLQSLIANMTEQPSAYVLDFGGPIQENIDFFGGRGQRLYVDDLLHAYEYFFSAKEQSERIFHPGRVEEFIESTFNFADRAADAILLWDRLQFLPANVTTAVVARLRRALAPRGSALALFRPDPLNNERRPYSCRILDGQSLMLKEQEHARPMETFTTRSIERLFEGFGFREVRFFVSRESIQEVIIRG